MPKLNDMFPSRYLKAADFEDGDAVVTIERLEEDTVGQGKDAKDVWIVYFTELDKGLVLNKTNTVTIGKLYGDDTDDWTGKKITLFSTEVQYQSDMVAAIRIRSKPPKARQKPVAVKAEAPVEAEAPDDDDDDSIPF